jgi:hypothetical protein
MKPNPQPADRVATVENEIEDLLEVSIYDEVEDGYDDVVDDARRGLDD